MAEIKAVPLGKYILKVKCTVTVTFDVDFYCILFVGVGVIARGLGHAKGELLRLRPFNDRKLKEVPF